MRIVATASFLLLLYISPFQTLSQSQSISLRHLRVPYTEHFDAMDVHGRRLPAGWYVGLSSPGDTILRIEKDGPNPAGHFNRGLEDSSDRAIGSRASQRRAQFIESRFQNLTDTALVALFLRYDGVQWMEENITPDESGLMLAVSENGGPFTVADRDFWFRPRLSKVSSASRPGTGDILKVGPIGGVYVFQKPIPPGGTFRLRWVDRDDDGFDASVGVDNVRVTPLSANENLSGAGSVSLINPELDSADIIESEIPQTVQLMIRGPQTGFLRKVRIGLPQSWDDVDSGMVRFVAGGGPQASLRVRAREIAIESASIAEDDPCVVEIAGVRIQSPARQDAPGYSTFRIGTAGEDDAVVRIAEQPVAYSLMPIASTHRRDSSGTPSLLGRMVAIAGTIINSESLSRGRSEYYLQDETSGLRILSDDPALTFREGELCVVKGRLDLAEGTLTLIPTFIHRKGSEPVLDREYGSIANLLQDARTAEGALVLIRGRLESESVERLGPDGKTPTAYFSVSDPGGSPSIRLLDRESSGIEHDAIPKSMHALRGIFTRIGSGLADAGGWTIIPRTRGDIDPVLEPPAPHLLEPSNDALDQAPTLTLGWSGTPHTERYHVQLGSDSSFATIVYQDSMVTDTTLEVNSLESGRTYYWRVSGWNERGRGDFSAPSKFTTLPHPLVRILTPSAGDTLSSGSAPVELQVSYFEFDSLAFGFGDSDNHRGHVRISIDGEFARADDRPGTHVSRLSPGTHTVTVELVSADGHSLEPPVADTITVFVARNAPRLEMTPSSAGNYFIDHNSSSLTVHLAVRNVTRAGRSNSLSPSYTIYSNGRKLGTSSQSSVDITRLGPGIHHLRAELEVEGEGTGRTRLFDESWIRIPDTAPFLEVTSPANGDTVHGKMIPILIRKVGVNSAEDSAQSSQRSPAGFMIVSVDGMIVDSMSTDSTTLDLSIQPGVHRIRVDFLSGSGEFLTPPLFDISEIVLKVPTLRTGSEELPSEFTLMQNYPNPFNAETEIRFRIPDQSLVSLRVFNLLGQEVVTLLDQELEPGTHTARWNGLNSEGKKVSSGIYVYRLQAGNFVATRRMMLLK